MGLSTFYALQRQVAVVFSVTISFTSMTQYDFFLIYILVPFNFGVAYVFNFRKLLQVYAYVHLE